ncbi:hypothetical protein KGF54_000448 [Candida jiufengensis]|uniref:uncharacterized protein n=1 Tax=Candida jiufengensis TaxID=497108 RepID=UPI002224BB4C|nr:uncharacterized protein KGF54_000448 [Candida jiufengensis]KAI5956830.1 hypothetical protein KGF54_000448 [Candida jiufengensis]
MATPQKKYICGFCAKAFTRSEHKQRHERSHTNEKPYHCLYCTSSFVRRDLLQRHCRTVHQSENLSGIVPNPSTNNNNNVSHNYNHNQSSTFNTNSSNASHQQQQQQQQQLNQIQQQNYSLPQPHTLQYNDSSLSNNNLRNSNQYHCDTNETVMPSSIAMTPANSTNSNNSDNSNYSYMNTVPTATAMSSSSTSSKKRRSSSDVQTRKVSVSSSITSTNSDNSLINLLSITKKLKYILNLNSSPNSSNDMIYDCFLIGYITLQEQSNNFSVIESILKDLIYYLSTYYIDPVSASSSIPPPQPNLFKVGIIYSIISLGYILNKNPLKSLAYFKKSWVLLIRNLIPQYNNSNIPIDQIEIANNLFLLSFIYINYDLEDYDLNQNMDQDQQTIYLNNQVMLDYLDQISFIIISNLSEFTNPNEKLIDSNINLFWSIFILLSFYLENSPKIYPILLHKVVDQDQTLFETMKKFQKNSLIIDENEFLKNIIIATLTNELKTNEESDPKIFENKNVLHNSVILINKSINYFQNNMNKSSNNDSSEKIFKIFKKNLIINCPLKFHELLNNYIFVPQHFNNWQLLLLILKENIINLNLDRFLKAQLGKSSSHELNPNNDLNSFLIRFLDLKNYSIEINNNLSIVSLPIIFLSNFLQLPHNSIKFQYEYNIIQLKTIHYLVVLWYLIMNKVLIMIWYYENETTTKTNLRFEENYILQTLIYMLLDDKSVFNNYLSPPPTTAEKIFEFNGKWFWIIKNKLKLVFLNWINILESEIDAKLELSTTKTSGKQINKLSYAINEFIDEYMTVIYNSYEFSNKPSGGGGSDGFNTQNGV